MKNSNIYLLKSHFNIDSIVFRRALRMSLAVFFSVILYRYFNLTQGFWVPLTIIIVMQATTAATLRKGLQRFLGTIIGIIIGSALVIYVKNPYILDGLLILSLFIAYYMKAFILINYGIFTVPITIMVVFLVSDLVPQNAPALIVARLYDTSLGAMLAILFSFFIFPNSLSQDVKKGLHQLVTTQFSYLLDIFSNLIEKPQAMSTLMQRKLESGLAENRRLFADWRYELLLRTNFKREHLHFLVLSEKTSQFLFSLDYLVQNHCLPLPAEIKLALQELILSVQIMQNTFLEKNEIQPSIFSQALDKFIRTTLTINSLDNAVFAGIIIELKAYQHSLLKLAESIDGLSGTFKG